MKVWVDDLRVAPEGYIWCKSTNEALCLITENINDIEIIHLDHDMGDTFGGDAIAVLEELERLSRNKTEFAQAVKKITFKIHTANPVGEANMRAIIEYNGWHEER